MVSSEQGGFSQHGALSCQSCGCHVKRGLKVASTKKSWSNKVEFQILATKLSNPSIIPSNRRTRAPAIAIA